MKVSGGGSHGLTFHWPHVPKISATLIGFFLLSLLVHAFTFYLFQIVYPPVATISPPSAQINILTPTPENQALLKWIDAEDPAAIANPREVIPANLHEAPYRPSFAEIRTAPKPPDEQAAIVPFPEARSGLDLVKNVEKPRKPTAQPRTEIATSIKFSGDLSRRKIAAQPALKLDPSSSSSLDPLSFLVGVDEEGKVAYVFSTGALPSSSSEMRNSSGDETLDREAAQYLNRVQFSADPGHTSWGAVTFFWGSDAYKIAAPSAP
jgi:hypothetical protein